MIKNFGNKVNTNGLDRNPSNRNSKGRPKRITTTLKDAGFSKADIQSCCSIIADLTPSELEELSNNKETTVLELTIIKAFQAAAKSGDYNKIKDLIQLFVGKPSTSASIQIDARNDGKILTLVDVNKCFNLSKEGE